MNKIRTSLFSILVLVLLLSTSVIYAAEGTPEIGSASQANCNFASGAYAAGGEFSADDLYEPATLESLEEAKALAVCLELVVLPASSGNFSGDDAYDLAATGTEEIGSASQALRRSYSFDVAAIGTAEIGNSSQALRRVYTYDVAAIGKEAMAPRVSLGDLRRIYSFDVAPVSADVNTFSANPELSVAQFTTDVAPMIAEINTFSANPELSVAQFTTDIAPVSLGDFRRGYSFDVAAIGTAEIGRASQANCNFASGAYAAGGEFSADDLYESATLESFEESKALAVCLESKALPVSAESFSGDDAYDPAAGGLG
jgi:hypothetical protein